MPPSAMQTCAEAPDSPMLASLGRARRTAPPLAPPSRARQRARAADASTQTELRAAPATGDAGRRMALAAGAPQPGLTVNVKNAAGLRAAVANGSIGRIVLAAGNYSLTSAMCHPKDPFLGDLGPTGLCVGRAVTLAAAQAGTVVLDAGKKGRVLYVNGSGVELVGLNITGGKIVSARLSNFWSLPLLAFSRAVDSLFSHAGGGCSLESGAHMLFPLL